MEARGAGAIKQVQDFEATFLQKSDVMDIKFRKCTSKSILPKSYCLHNSMLESVQDFLIKLDMKPCMYLWK